MLASNRVGPAPVTCVSGAMGKLRLPVSGRMRASGDGNGSAGRAARPKRFSTEQMGFVGRVIVAGTLALVVSALAAAAAPGARQDQDAPPASQPTTQPDAETGEANPPAEGFDLAGSDPEAIRIADEVMEAMGGRKAWDETHYIAWTFFAGDRKHIWDKHAGRSRIDFTDEEGARHVSILDLKTKRGRAWVDGVEVTDAAELERLLDQAEGWWINDSYWLVMPYKLKDTGVTLKYRSIAKTHEGTMSDVLELTFRGVGRTPRNRYVVHVARDSRLVEQWTFYETATNRTETFTTPWHDWRRYGRIMLSAEHHRVGGMRARMKDIAVFDEMPESVFTSPDPVDLKSIAPAPETAGG